MQIELRVDFCEILAPTLTDHQLDQLRAALRSEKRDLRSEQEGTASQTLEAGHRPDLVAAAVLVPLHMVESELSAIFTRRRAELAHHPGEISFPGGVKDASDHDLVAAALREFEEELGVSPQLVEIVGELEPTPTVATDFLIYPFVGVITGVVEFVRSDLEVAEILDISLQTLRSNYKSESIVVNGRQREVDVYNVDGQVIWGATARIVSDLLSRVPRDFRLN